MKVKSLIFLFYLIITFNIFAQEEVDLKPIEREVVVGIFKTEKLDFAASPKIQISPPGFLAVDFNPAKRTITFRGVKPGNAGVLIYDLAGNARKQYRVTVSTNSLATTAAELKEFLGDIEGLEIGIKGGKVVVEGQLVVPRDIGKIVAILDRYKEVIRLIELSPQTQRVVARKMVEEMQKSGLAEVQVRIVNKTFWLEGTVTSERLKQKAFDIAKGYLPDQLGDLAQQTGSLDTVKREIIQNFIEVNATKEEAPLPKLVKIIAQFVEMRKDYLRKFGFKWVPTIEDNGTSISFGKTQSGTVTTKSGNGSIAGTISNLLPKLQSAKGAGYARVVQTGMLIIKNNVQGKLNKVSKVPFALGVGEFTQAQEASIGFDLTIKPNIKQKENIELDIGLSVSSSNSSNGAAPITQDNRISTVLLVKSKETAVVGGVSLSETDKAYDKDPPFGRTQQDPESNASPLFEFIKSKSYANKKTQFIVFLTPEIIDSASRNVEKFKKKFRKRRR